MTMESWMRCFLIYSMASSLRQTLRGARWLWQPLRPHENLEPTVTVAPSGLASLSVNGHSRAPPHPRGCCSNLRTVSHSSDADAAAAPSDDSTTHPLPNPPLISLSYSLTPANTLSLSHPLCVCVCVVMEHDLWFYVINKYSLYPKK